MTSSQAFLLIFMEQWPEEKFKMASDSSKIDRTENFTRDIKFFQCCQHFVMLAVARI
jgi:hypothetical protein